MESLQSVERKEGREEAGEVGNYDLHQLMKDLVKM